MEDREFEGNLILGKSQFVQYDIDVLASWHG